MLVSIGCVYSCNCSHDMKDVQAVGKLTAFKSNNLTAPSAVITGTAQFNQLGTYVTLASYQDNDVIIASSTAAGTVAACLPASLFLVMHVELMLRA